MTVRSREHYQQKLGEAYCFLPERAISELKFTEEAEFSVSPFQTALDVARMTEHVMREQLGLRGYAALDLTSCVGGDTFAQSLCAFHVEGYEFNEATYNCLVHNLQVYENYGHARWVKRIQVFNASSVDHYLKPQSIEREASVAAIIDPPWGGPEFKTKKDIRLQLGGVAVEDLVQNLLTQKQNVNCRLVVLKLPWNYDLEYLKGRLSGFQTAWFKRRSIQFVFALGKEESKFSQPQLTKFAQGNGLLQDPCDLLLVKNFGLFRSFLRRIFNFDKEAEELQDNFHDAIAEARKTGVFRITITQKANVNLRSLAILAAVIVAAYNFQVAIAVQLDDARAVFQNELSKLPDFVQKLAPREPSITVFQSHESFKPNFTLQEHEPAQGEKVAAAIPCPRSGYRPNFFKCPDPLLLLAELLARSSNWADWLFQKLRADESSYSSEYTWLSQFLAKPEFQQLLTPVPIAFFQESLSLYELEQEIEYFKEALQLIVDNVYDCEEGDVERVERAATILYAKAHQRYVKTAAALEEVKTAYQNGAYGSCPRLSCGGQHTLPYGGSQDPGKEVLRGYCPSCGQLYKLYQANADFYVDGCFFGPDLPGMFMTTFPGLFTNALGSGEPQEYIPRIYGFELYKNVLRQTKGVVAAK